MFNSRSAVIPGRATWREPGIHNHETQFGAGWVTIMFEISSGGYGFRARASRVPE
jgi:hypothetical protein